MNIFNDYEKGRSIRQANKPVTECENSEQVNGYWRQDQERQSKKQENTGLHILIKPYAAGQVGYRAS